MYIQTLKNGLLFCGMLALWLVLITIEVVSGYSGIFLQVVYGFSMFALFVAFWLTNRTTVQNIQSQLMQFFASGAMAVTLMGLFLFVAIISGANFKILIEGWMK
jgi:hypothetical protein